MSKLSEEAPSGKEEEEEEQPKTPRKMSSLFSDDDGDDTKGAEERVGEEEPEARETASFEALDAYGSGTEERKEEEKEVRRKAEGTSRWEERSKPMFASQL